MNIKYPIIYLISILVFLFACSKENSASAQEAIHNIDIATLEQMMSADSTIAIIDVRTPQETQQGKIKDALEANVLESSLFEQQIASLDKEQTYVLYCRSGKRSTKASQILKEKGFKNIYNLTGGYQAWKKTHP